MGMKTLQNIRYVLYSINVMTATLAATYISFGSRWLMFDQRHTKAAVCRHISVGGFLIAFGVLLLVCVLVGLLGVVRDDRRLQKANSTLVLLLVFIYMDFGIVTLTIGNPDSAYMKRLHKEVVNRFRNPKKETPQFFDFVQTEFKCCGVDGHEDYKKYRNTTKFYPESCCKNRSPCTEPDYKTGCGKKIIQYRWQRFQMSAVLCFAFVVVGVSDAVFICLLKREKKRQMQMGEELELSRREEEAKSVKSDPETEEAVRKRRERERKENTVMRVKEILTVSSSSEVSLEEPRRAGRKKLKVHSERSDDVEKQQFTLMSRVQIHAEMNMQ